MNQRHLPKATSGSETKRFWSKVKQSSKGLSSSLGNLSIHSEHDGSSETETLVHKALVNYYQGKNQPYPEWLGVQEKQVNNHDQQRQQQYRPPYQKAQPQEPVEQRRSVSLNVASSREDNYDRGQRSAPAPLQRRGTSENSKYSLSDIYNRSATDLRSASQPQAQQPRYQQQMTPSYREDLSSRPVSARANSTSSNRLKERAMKQNKQSFDSYAANSSASSFSSLPSQPSASHSRTGIFRRN